MVKRTLALVTALACLSGPILAQSPAAPATPSAGYYVFQKVAYQNDSGWPDDRAYFGHMLQNVANHIAATSGNVELRIVSFGNGLKLFQLAKTDQGFAASLDGLRAKGVRFLICRNTMEGLGLQRDALYGVQEDDIVPSGVAELARLQGLGFVYIHP